MKLVFPCAIILLNSGASFVYAYQRDVRHALYWAFAAAITATVTF